MNNNNFFIIRGIRFQMYKKRRVGIIYYSGTTNPPPETDSFNGGGQIYFKVSELKCRFLQDVDHQGVTPNPKHCTIQPSLIVSKYNHKYDVSPL